MLHYKFVEQASAMFFMVVFSISIGYFTIVSLVKFFKQEFGDKCIRILDAVGILIGSIAAYSLCAAACLITSTI